MARIVLGYEENRGARLVVFLLAIALILCVAGVVANDWFRPYSSGANVTSSSSESSSKADDRDVIWFTAKDNDNSVQSEPSETK